ncbi:MAG TPA: hypothetical protein VLV31_01525 [Candidatus Acidoferrales bacterium]|nr:hypothetical protein [Candidatus Acidoferrales bacterium]
MQYLVFLSAGIFLVAPYVYIKSMLKGSAKPNRVSWLMWAIAPMISFVAAVSEGAGLAAVPVFMAGFCPFLIFVASFAVKGVQWKLFKLDYACGLLSGLAIVLWAVTSNPDIAIGFAILSDGLASVPTLIKGWKHPETETAWTYLVGVFGGLTSFFAITAWTFSQYAFPAYLVIVSCLLVLSVCHRTVFTSF